MLKKLCIISFLLLGFFTVSFAQDEFEQGKNFYDNGDFENALRHFTIAVERDDKSQETWRFLGITYARLKMYDLANQALISAGKLRPADNIDNYKKIKFLSRPIPAYSEIDQKEKVEGSVDIVVEFNKDGTVAFAYPFRSLTDPMTQKALEAAYKIKFEPALLDSEKITEIKIISYRLSFI